MFKFLFNPSIFLIILLQDLYFKKELLKIPLLWPKSFYIFFFCYSSFLVKIGNKTGAMFSAAEYSANP